MARDIQGSIDGDAEAAVVELAARYQISELEVLSLALSLLKYLHDESLKGNKIFVGPSERRIDKEVLFGEWINESRGR